MGNDQFFQQPQQNQQTQRPPQEQPQQFQQQLQQQPTATATQQDSGQVIQLEIENATLKSKVQDIFLKCNKVFWNSVTVVLSPRNTKMSNACQCCNSDERSTPAYVDFLNLAVVDITWYQVADSPYFKV